MTTAATIAKMHTLICTVLLIISSGRAWAGKPAAAVELSNQLDCGSAQLHAHTRLKKALSTHVVRQRLTLNGAKTALKPEQAPNQPRLNRTDSLPFYLSGWACLTNAKQQAFFYLVYYCGAESGCGKDKEWARLMSLDGRILNPQAADLETVMRTNGLERYGQAGVELLDPLE
ncbi:MAG: hypothetical protein U1F46_00370 [Marinagarivorans sp.]